MRSKISFFSVLAVLSLLSAPCFAQVIPSSSGEITTFTHFVNNVQTNLYDLGDNVMIRATAHIDVDAAAPELGIFVLDVKIYTLFGGLTIIADDADEAVIGAGQDQVMIEDTNVLILSHVYVSFCCRFQLGRSSS